MYKYKKIIDCNIFLLKILNYCKICDRISVKYRNNWLYDISMDYDHLFFNSVFNTQEFSSAKYQGIEI